MGKVNLDKHYMLTLTEFEYEKLKSQLSVRNNKVEDLDLLSIRIKLNRALPIFEKENLSGN